MRSRRGGILSVQTATLVFILIVMIFSLFVLLPANLPSINSIDQDIFWACTYWGSAPERLFTWTWDTDRQPTVEEWLNILIEAQYYQAIKCDEISSSPDADNSEAGILQYIHRIMPNDEGLGKFTIETVAENESMVNISGYLQYGTLPEVDDYILARLKENEAIGLEEAFILNMSSLLIKAPFPHKTGVVKNEKLTITLTHFYKTSHVSEQYTTKTDLSGFFSYVLEPDPNAEYYTIRVSNQRLVIAPESSGETLKTYFENSTVYTTYLNCNFSGSGGTRSTEKNLAWLFTGFVIVGALFLLIWYLRHRRKYLNLDEADDFPERKTRMRGDIRIPPGGDTERLEILFPQIEEPLPDVWGANEPFDVIVLLKDDTGSLIPNKECLISWGDKEENTAISDSLGEIRLSHTFTINGEYSVTGSYHDNTQHKVTSWRIIRIVDYREEMVNLFNQMLYILNLESIDTEMTPREIEKTLVAEISEVPLETIRRVVAGFEEANYSTHEIERRHYTRMCLAVIEVIDSGRKERNDETTE